MSMMLMVEAMHAKVGSPIRKLVLIKLADNANDKGECWPSYQHIADHCEVSKRSVINHINWLCDNGFISKEVRVLPHGNTSNLYRVSIGNGGAANSPGGAEDSLGGGAGNSPRISHSLESINEHSLSASADVSKTLTKQPENCPHQEIIALWHELMPELTSVKTWNEKRAKMLKARWNGKDMEGNKFNNLKFWRKYFEYIRESDWLMGKTGSGWSATLEWVITESNFNKIIEGTYHNAN